MKIVHTIALAALAGTFAAPVFAAAHADPMMTTCADYEAMDDTGKMEAVTAMSEAAMADEEMMAKMPEEAMTPEQNMEMIAAACDGNPDMMAVDGMMKAE